MTKQSVFVDIGHGGGRIKHDRGSQWFGATVRSGDRWIKEKDINLQVGLKVASELVRREKEVHLNRTTDERQRLHERYERANARVSDVFVSIHCDWFRDESAKGPTVFFFEYSNHGKNLARIIRKVFMDERIDARHIKPSDSERDRDMTPYLEVLKMTRMPAVLVECGFMSNNDDLKRLLSGDGQHQTAYCIAKGISDGLEKM